MASRRHLFPRLQIREKLLIAFVGLSVLPVLFVTVYGLYVNVRTTERIALENLAHDLSLTQERASNFLSDIEGDVRLLLNSAATQNYIDAVEHGTSPDREARLNSLGLDLLAFARTKALYYQIHILNMEREEVLRVESPDILDSVPRFLITPASLLNAEGGSYYFLLTRHLKAGEIAFSPSELVYRGSQRIPVLSFATPLLGRSGQVGLLVANVFAGNLFNEVDAQRNPELNGKTVLVGSDGHYLYDSDERADWNRLIAAREEDNLQRDYPASIAATILSGREGIITEGSDAIIAYAPLFPAALASQPETDARFTTSMAVFEEVPRATITREARASILPFVGFLALFFCGALVLGLLATRQFTRPLSTLRRGAEVIAGGNYDHLLQIDTGDEIEALARQFNTMAQSLVEHERELQHHRATLEETVDARTRELVVEKGKLQAILDNVPSAFVVLDRNSRIQTASAAFTSITGLSLDAVIGQDSRAVLRDNALCQLAGDPGAAPPARMESHVDRFVDRNGAEQFLEHTTIPMIDGGECTAILQILTNITKRKRLEEHLIQSEKLMATGEMAAIIAHGFRNSLTSIKMILQLQEEAASLPRGSRRSLRVALESIERMEGVVHELLNFARPAPLVFALADLNQLVQDGLGLLA
ncbi:MAG TPA: HAMP domain-containing protein, partial [Bacteroidota bacterium]